MIASGPSHVSRTKNVWLHRDFQRGSEYTLTHSGMKFCAKALVLMLQQGGDDRNRMENNKRDEASGRCDDNVGRCMNDVRKRLNP
jgi:hypothetical protein